MRLERMPQRMLTRFSGKGTINAFARRKRMQVDAFVDYIGRPRTQHKEKYSRESKVAPRESRLCSKMSTIFCSIRGLHTPAVQRKRSSGYPKQRPSLRVPFALKIRRGHKSLRVGTDVSDARPTVTFVSLEQQHLVALLHRDHCAVAAALECVHRDASAERLQLIAAFLVEVAVNVRVDVVQLRVDRRFLGREVTSRGAVV